MKTLFTLEEMIEPVLQAYPETRDSDKELALAVWRIYYGVSTWTPVTEVFRNSKIPSVESIGRIRRKLQANDETLRGSKAGEKKRLNAQQDYIEYSFSDR